jgi:predicted nicotinamide N-methyase
MEQNPSHFSISNLSGKSVLELGSGCGLGGIAFMMKGARVVLTDLPSVVDELTTLNSTVTSA